MIELIGGFESIPPQLFRLIGSALLINTASLESLDVLLDKNGSMFENISRFLNFIVSLKYLLFTPITDSTFSNLSV